MEIVKQHFKRNAIYLPYNTSGKLKDLLKNTELIEINQGKEKKNSFRLPIGSQYDRERYYYIKQEVINSLLSD